MAPAGTLWGSSLQPQTKIIRSVAALNDLELKLPEWSYTNKPAEFTSKFPYGKVPAFEGLDGFTLTEGASIARYLSGVGTKVNLLGSNTQEIALIDQWIHFAEQEIGHPSHDVITLVHGFAGPFTREGLDKAIERLFRALDLAESHLAARPSGYLVSDRLTLADFFLVGMTYGSAYMALGAAERAKYPHVFAHYDRVGADERLPKGLWGKEGFTEVAVKEPKPLPAQ